MNWMKSFWEKWKAFGHKVGDFQARLILTLFYFVVICPFAMVIRFGAKPLRLKSLHASNWRRSEVDNDDSDSMARARRQF